MAGPARVYLGAAVLLVVCLVAQMSAAVMAHNGVDHGAHSPAKPPTPGSDKSLAAPGLPMAAAFVATSALVALVFPH
ncbi:unnamed protein product [Spirodela intermedia]|uniref:Uncharacterized protein n=1 Tax=Spirodela intermedia TaxID=51605 RepID=A0A7I8KSD2_SPIIN|nr:unnamed protein product [Spirodela intermedia]